MASEGARGTLVAESDIHCVMVDDADEGVVPYTYTVNGYWLAAAIHLFVSIFVYYISCTNSSQKATKPECFLSSPNTPSLIAAVCQSE